MKFTTETNNTVYFMVGGPAAGKSTVRAKLLPNIPTIDVDDYNNRHPAYDPKNMVPEVHAHAKVEAMRAFYAQLATGETFVFDSTGTNVEKMVGMINAAHEAGYTVAVVYVSCTLADALERNQKRERRVPESIVRDKHSTVGIVFDIISKYADTIQVMNN
jgi:predicted kinase